MNPVSRFLRRSRFWALMLVVALAWGWAAGLSAQETSETGQVDWQTQHGLGAQVYVESCGGCHTALPPSVMPSDTWRSLLVDPNHYGVQLENLPSGPLLQAAWRFMSDFSRERQQFEPIPYRLSESRYFRALHPDVTFEGTIRATGCVDCHPRANLGDFVSLAAEW